MDMFTNCIAVGIGGAFGAVCRYLLGLLPLRSGTGFPATTLGINIFGAFIIGLLMALVEKDAHLNPYLLMILKVGFCGGFTTFSTFSMEAFTLMREGKVLTSLIYMLLSVFLCLLAIVCAQVVVKEI